MLGIAYFAFDYVQSDSSGHAHQHAERSHATESAVAPRATIAGAYPNRRQQIAWQVVSDAKSIDQTLWPNLPDFAEFVDLNREFDQWLLGTPVEIQIPQTGKTYAATVDRIVPNGKTSHTIHAIPSENEQELERFIVTFNDTSTLAYVSTKAGVWELVGNAETGWIVSTQDLDASRDYSEPDLLVQNYDRYKDAEYVPRRND